MTSGDSDAGPMVQTIRVLWAGRITKHPPVFRFLSDPPRRCSISTLQDCVAAGCQFVYSGGDAESRGFRIGVEAKSPYGPQTPCRLPQSDRGTGLR